LHDKHTVIGCKEHFQNHMAFDCVLGILSAEEEDANIYMIALSFRNLITLTKKLTVPSLKKQRKGTDSLVTILLQPFLLKTLDGRTAAHSMYLAPQEGTNGCNPGRWMLLNLLPSVDKQRGGHRSLVWTDR
jgi:hypothetical protein